VLTAAAAVLLAAPAPMLAQDTSLVVCAGERIGAITVISAAPSVSGVRRIPVVAQVARAMHTTTRADVIRRFLLVNTGDRCDALRLAESERILRAQPFISDATIRAVRTDSGEVELEVRTSDEASLIVGGRFIAGMPPVRAFRFGNSNVGGGGVYLAAGWRSGEAYRDGFSGRFAHHQLFGRPYYLEIMGDRRPLGEEWRMETAHPFLTDLQRIAWRLRSGAEIDYARFAVDDDVDRALRVDRRYFDVGGMIRIGPPGRLSLFGASLSAEDERTAGEPVLITRDGLRPDSTDMQLRDRYAAHRIARANVLWGVRDLNFVRVRGFDALTATQDVPIGFQLGTMFGRSLSVLGSRDDDIFLAADLYLGAGGRYNIFRVQLQAEGRRASETATWDGILTSGRIAHYVRMSTRHTMLGSVEWSGGWKQRVPFALTLSDGDGGVRGYSDARLPGAQRLVGRIESRYVIGRIADLAEVGAGLFVDAGQTWAGDIPYGVTSPVRAAVGFSILAAVPPGSARLWRLDLAVAQDPEPGQRRLEVRFSGADNTRFFFREPRDVDRVRERTVPSSVFRWP
jgi:hypothetical protein